MCHILPSLLDIHLIDCVENFFYGEGLMINEKIIKHLVAVRLPEKIQIKFLLIFFNRSV